MAKRKLSGYNRCMAKNLKGKMKGKSKSERRAMFKKVAHQCKGK